MPQIHHPENFLSRVELVIHGQVQDVNFRHFTENFLKLWNQFASSENQITGTIGNLPDGTVGICLEAPEHELERIIPLFYLGSPSSKVERVEENQWQQISAREFSDFSRSN